VQICEIYGIKTEITPIQKKKKDEKSIKKCNISSFFVKNYFMHEKYFSEKIGVKWKFRSEMVLDIFARKSNIKINPIKHLASLCHRLHRFAQIFFTDFKFYLCKSVKSVAKKYYA